MSRFAAIAASFVASCVFFVGCERQPGLEQLKRAGDVVRQVETRLSGGSTERPAASAAPVAGASDTIRVASFNIQVLGTSKARKPHVMKVLADVIRRFDVVAIQELRTKESSVMESLLQLVNQDGAEYQYVVGPRLGRTVSKEQYVFVFDPHRVELLPDTLFTIDDPQDLLHREPLIGRFRARTVGSGEPFTFVLVNIHTDPDETKTELDALGDVFVAVQQNPWREDDVILLGDLNVDYRKLGKLGTLPDIAYTVQGEKTNTRGTKSYDNIVFNQVTTSEFTGTAAVFDLQQEYGLAMSQALEVSDHLPVWAEFQTVESGGGTLLASRRPLTPTEPVPLTATPGAAAPRQPVAESPQRPGLRGLLGRAKEKAQKTISRTGRLR